MQDLDRWQARLESTVDVCTLECPPLARRRPLGHVWIGFL